MKVRLPDKKIILNFPDGMSEDDMRDAIIRNFYPEQLGEHVPEQGGQTPQEQADAFDIRERAQGFTPAGPHEGDYRERRDTAETGDLGDVLSGLGNESLRKAGLLSSGIMSGASRIPEGMSWVADKAYAEQWRDILSNIAQRWENYASDIRKTATGYGSGGEDLSMMDQIVQAAGTSAPAMALGAAAAPSAMLGGVAGTPLSATGADWTAGGLTAQALRTFMDALGEAGSVQNEILRKGGTPEQAAAASNKVFTGNAALDAILETTIGPFGDLADNFKSPVARWLARTAGSAGEEVLQEPLQDIIHDSGAKTNPDGSPLTSGQFMENFAKGGRDFPRYLAESGVPAGGSALLTALLGVGAAGERRAGDFRQETPAPELPGGPAPTSPGEARPEPAQTQARTEPVSPVAETPPSRAEGQDAAKVSPEIWAQRGELLRWGTEETDRMTEAAEFSGDDGPAVNALAEEDLRRFQEIRDAMKRRDYARLHAMREEAQAAGRQAPMPLPAPEPPQVSEPVSAPQEGPQPVPQEAPQPMPETAPAPEAPRKVSGYRGPSDVDPLEAAEKQAEQEGRNEILHEGRRFSRLKDGTWKREGHLSPAHELADGGRYRELWGYDYTPSPFTRARLKREAGQAADSPSASEGVNDPEAQALLAKNQQMLNRTNSVQKASKIMSSDTPEGKAAREIYNRVKQETLAGGMDEKAAQKAGFDAVVESVAPAAAGEKFYQPGGGERRAPGTGKARRENRLPNASDGIGAKLQRSPRFGLDDHAGWVTNAWAR